MKLAALTHHPRAYLYHHRLFLAVISLSMLHAQDLSPKLVLEQPTEIKQGPDSLVQPGVPQGKITSFFWTESQIFPRTRRQVSVYVPAHHDSTKETAVMVFQDAPFYLNPKGGFRAPTVLDNLIFQKAIPPMIAIFIEPGRFSDEKGANGRYKYSNRSIEYDTLSDSYSRFLLEEILPEVGKTHALSKDPARRGICGTSSGGICAWTVAWQRPDQFRKVLSTIGSFTNIRGGDAYPGMIRKTERKPIRGFFQDGLADLDNEHGSWPLANMQMEAALRFKDYDFKYVWDQGAHNDKGPGAAFPAGMRWLWRN